MKINRLLSTVLIIGLIACDNDNTPVISPAAMDYLNQVLHIMEQNSINKNTIDWTDFKSQVFAKVQGAQTIADTYPGITEALRLLGDNHSSLIKPNGDAISYRTIQCHLQNIVKPTLPDNIGYVKVNSFAGPSNDDAATSFANKIQHQIATRDNQDIIGWIVDLRGNLGGNMWPMLAGIGPVLGEGIVGHFVTPDGDTQPWRYENGASKAGSFVATQVTNPYALIEANPKVAVLLDNGIASSGEVIAICFIGRENTKSFGSPTCGLSTANQSFPLKDGAFLVLAVSHLADRNKNTFGNAIFPDQASSNEKIIQDAVAWLEE